MNKSGTRDLEDALALLVVDVDDAKKGSAERESAFPYARTVLAQVEQPLRKLGM